MIIWQLMSKMNLDIDGVISIVQKSNMSRIFVFDDWHTKQNFFKQFISGIFITIVMTGLDQDMMQKNLSIKALKESQKNMYFYGIAFIPVNLLFLTLGILLISYATQSDIALPETSDEILPLLSLIHISEPTRP